MSTAAAQKTGLFIVSYQVTSGLLGAPTLLLNLAVNTPEKSINGQSQVTQAVNPTTDVRSNLQGDFTYMTVMPKNTHILVTASGAPALNWPVHGGVGPALPTNFQLRMVLESDWKSGTASYRYQTSDGQWHEVNDAPVKTASL